MNSKEIQMERTDAVIGILGLLVDECAAERKSGVSVTVLVELKREMQRQYREIKDSK